MNYQRNFAIILEIKKTLGLCCFIIRPHYLLSFYDFFTFCTGPVAGNTDCNKFLVALCHYLYIAYMAEGENAWVSKYYQYAMHGCSFVDVVARVIIM